MHQNIFHKLCFHLALLAVMLFSIAGYHHHEETHICLGWEHLMHHNHCHKGLPCLPNDTNGNDSSCSCHSGRLLAVESQQKESIRKQEVRSSQTFCIFSYGFLSSIFPNHLRKYSNHAGPRSPAPPQLRAHGLRAPPYFVF